MESCFLANRAAGQQRAEKKKIEPGPAQPTPPCGFHSRPKLHPAHLPTSAPAVDNRLPRYPSCASIDEIHPQYSAPPALPAAPYRSYSLPRPPRASSRPHTPPASKYNLDPTLAGYTP